MRKILLTICFVIALNICTFAEEPLAHMDTEYGIIDVVGYEVQDLEEGLFLFVFFDWENTKDEADTPSWNYSFKGYQNGRELSSGFCWSYEPDADNTSVSIQPGYSLRYYTCFELNDLSPIDMDVHEIMNMKSKVEFSIDPSTSGLNVAPETPVSDEPDAPTIGDVIAELEQRIADLEARVDALEKQ